MEIIFGENPEGKIKFHKTIGEKTYSYNGNLDKVCFIEDVVFSTISKYKPELINKNFCSITAINKEKYIISFYNDITGEKQNGDASIEYSLKDFSEDEIKQYINLIITEQNYDNETIVLLSVENNIFTFNNLKNDLDEVLVLKEEELEVEVLISGYKKYAKSIILLIILISIITGLIYGSSYLKNTFDSEIKNLDGQKKSAEKKKKDIEKEIMEEKIKFNKLETKKNLFEPNNIPELDQKIYSIGLPEPIKEKNQKK